MKFNRLVLIFAVLFAAALFAAIHPANPNKLCARPGCGHYHYWHANGNGPCEYSDPFVLPGHCPGIVHQ